LALLDGAASRGKILAVRPNENIQALDFVRSCRLSQMVLGALCKGVETAQ